MTLGKKLRKIRHERLEGMGLRRIAREVGTDYAHLSRIERNLAMPSANLLQRIAKAYKLTDSEVQEVFLLASKLSPDIESKIKKEKNIKKTLSFFRSLKML